MKLNITICFLAVTMLAFAQKREIQKIEKALLANDFAEAQKVFSTINVSEVEDEFKAGYKLAEGFLKLGDVQASKASLEDVLAAKTLIEEAKTLGYDKPEYVTMGLQSIKSRLYKLAEQLLVKNDLKGAAKLLETLYSMDTTNLAYANDIANMYYAGGELKKAYEYYSLLFEKEYDGVTTLFLAERTTNGAIVEYDTPDLRARDLKLGLVINPTQKKTESVAGDIVLKLVYLENTLGSNEEARKLFSKAKTVYMNDASLNVVSPEIYLQLGMNDEYVRASEKLTNGVTDPRFFDKLAESAQGNAQWDLVIENYTKSLNLNEDNFPAQVNLSNAYIQKGNLDTTTAKEQETLYKTAITHLEKANAMMPKDENVIITLTQLYNAYKMEDKLEALKAKQ